MVPSTGLLLQLLLQQTLAMPHGKSNPKRGQESLGKALQRRRALERTAADRYDFPRLTACELRVQNWQMQLPYVRCTRSPYEMTSLDDIPVMS